MGYIRQTTGIWKKVKKKKSGERGRERIHQIKRPEMGHLRCAHSARSKCPIQTWSKCLDTENFKGEKEVTKLEMVLECLL